MDVEQRDHQPGPLVVAADAARRLDVFGAGLGLAEDHHQPSRVMSRPTEIMFVAMATSTCSVALKAACQAPLRLGHLVGAHAAGQLHDLVGDLAVGEQARRFAHALAAAVARARLLTSSSMSRRAPPSSRRLLK